METGSGSCETAVTWMLTRTIMHHSKAEKTLHTSVLAKATMRRYVHLQLLFVLLLHENFARAIDLISKDSVTPKSFVNMPSLNHLMFYNQQHTLDSQYKSYTLA